MPESKRRKPKRNRKKYQNVKTKNPKLKEIEKTIRNLERLEADAIAKQEKEQNDNHFEK